MISIPAALSATTELVVSVASMEYPFRMKSNASARPPQSITSCTWYPLSTPARAVDPEMLRRLRALGYVQ